MKCAYCNKPIRVWQKKKPLGPGPLPLYGQYEHTDCHTKRDEFITKHLESLPEEYQHIHDEVQDRLYREESR